jgi:hypothetical protein
MARVERSTELRLPTVAVPVMLALVGRDPAPADVFMADVPRHGRSELLDDLAALLDEPAAFLPVRGEAGVRLLAKHSIAWLSVNRQDDDGDSDFADIPSEVMTLYDRQHRVEVALVTGSTLAGMLLDSSPADRPRVIDHLNRGGNFVRLWTSDEHFLINKAQILQVTELPWNAES